MKRTAGLGTLIGAALCSLALLGCGGGSSPAPAAPSTPAIQSSAAIWFHPLPADVAWPGGTVNGGAVDFLSVFQADAPWPRAMAKTQVIGVYAGWLTSTSDAQFQAFVDFLNSHGMGIEVEAPALQATASCGTGVEGYVPYGQSLQNFTLGYLQRLKAHGAQGLIIKVDEPYFFGQVAHDPRICNLSTAQIATQVGEYVQLVQTIYPDAVVGDVEPVLADGYIPDVVTALGQWHDTYQAVTGAAFPFYIADIDFSNPEWPSLVKQLELSTRQQGLQFGIIYIGDETDTSDGEWAGKAVARFEAYQGATGGNPDFVLFQSWEPYPQLCLPETDPTTFTGVLDAYLDATGR